MSQVWNSMQTFMNKITDTVIQSMNYSSETYGKNVTTAIFILAGPFIYAAYKLLAMLMNHRRHRKVYIRDFQVFQADPSWYCSNTHTLKQCLNTGCFGASQMNFMRKLSKRNGVGPKVSVPPELFQSKREIEDARGEARAVIFPTVKKLLEKTGISSNQIDVIVTNCSLFSPTPSLSSMVVNEFKMKKDIHSFSLGGQGCSASPIGADIIQAFLQNKNMKYALLISTESIMQNFYLGQDNSMLLPNTLFRAGCSVVLFTNVNYKCKYEVKQIVRTHIGADTGAHKCIYSTIDKDGKPGVNLEKSIIANAGKALTNNATRVFAKALPLHLKIDYILQIIIKRVVWRFQTKVRKIQTTYPKPAAPKINKAIDHFCFHTGGRGVLDSMQEQFELADSQIAASRASLYRYGNTSSASIWYELAYHESVRSVNKGNKVWQVAFGSGFKCNSLVLKALRNIRHDRNIFDESEPEYTLDLSVFKKDLVDDEEMKINYEEVIAAQEKKRYEEEWELVKAKYMDKMIAEISAKQVCEIK
ncbi:3-ketoacyl-CoA_synthase [Hexamita inflata]|uniref:3-ketoacyl-CoA synthase n=1 Tax=Hexamita inflata TaxID=28002 RepID=A0AA86RKR3_9EUKA|nr:3-ketoacyl-CoA synthase [Hexamita inflata]CAI9968345.1 3-ketoacyl-CoA synthase [Hexamita inflata]